MKVIAFVGKKGVGKSSAANITAEIYKMRGMKVRRLAFATPLKNFLSSVTQTCISDSTTEAFSNNALKDKNCLIGYSDNSINFFKPRELMTDVCAAIKKYDKHAFTYEMNRQIYSREKSDVIIIDDLRFKEELDMLMDLKPTMLHPVIEVEVVFINHVPETKLGAYTRKFKEYFNLDDNPSETGLAHLFDKMQHISIDNDKELGYNEYVSKIKKLIDVDFCPELYYTES